MRWRDDSLFDHLTRLQCHEKAAGGDMEIGDESSDEGEEEDEEEDSDEEDAAEAMHNTLPPWVGGKEGWPALLTARQQHVEQIVDGRVKGESMTSGDIADLVAGDSIPPLQCSGPRNVHCT